MFFVADTRENKKKQIRMHLLREPMLAVLMAAANFEWTVGRCILFFGFEPNVNLREKLSRCHGLEAYKQLWKKELTRKNPTIPPLTKIVENWNEFTDAFNLRHILIHGRGTCSKNMAKEPVEEMLLATDALYNFARSRGKNLNDRLPVRRKKAN